MGYFLPFYPPKSPKNQNFEKMKKPRDIIILNKCTKNYDQMMHSSWDMLHNREMDGQMDRQTDGQKKWHIEVGAPPKKMKGLTKSLTLNFTQYINVVCIPVSAGGVEPPTKFSKKGGLTGPQLSEGVAIFTKK